MQKAGLRHDQSAVVWASLASVALWFVPLLGLVSLPIEYLNALTHEMCHAITAVVTGGRVENIQVFPDGSGVTPIWGGSPPLVGSAGYIGASLIGVMILLFSRNPEGARTSLRLLAVSLAASLIFWVRGEFGIVTSIVWVAAMFVMAAYLPPKGALFAATFLGIQQCLHSLMALLTLAGVSLFTERHSDALLLQQTTGLPAAFWAVAWMGFSLTIMATALRGIWRR
jgi:hypothetical protein